MYESICYSRPQTPPLRGLGSWGRIAGAFSGPGPGAFSKRNFDCFQARLYYLVIALPACIAMAECYGVAIGSQYLIGDPEPEISVAINMLHSNRGYCPVLEQVVNKVRILLVKGWLSALEYECAYPDSLKFEKHTLEFFSAGAFLLVADYRAACDDGSSFGASV